MLGKAAEPGASLARGDDQWIENSLGLGQLVEEQAFANAEAGDGQPPRREHADQSVEQHRGIGQGRETGDGDRAEIGIAALSFSNSRNGPRRSMGRSCWCVTGKGCSVSAMSSRASARQEPPTR